MRTCNSPGRIFCQSITSTPPYFFVIAIVLVVAMLPQGMEMKPISVHELPSKWTCFNLRPD
ncbi:hypothetical protein K456DRAFT_760060 [Colletotrichum gloeosporioides 23]|nr:hypothetical protein K456DRAFT_760060 [Colletotrichum gloeosporioides 23]